MELYGALVAATPKNDSRRAWSKADRRWASGKRQIIEGVIGQLKDFFSLERHRAKTLGGLLSRSAAKIVAYTCAQRINDSLWPTAASSGGSVDLVHCTSVVLEERGVFEEITGRRRNRVYAAREILQVLQGFPPAALW